MNVPKKILVATDFNELSTAALRVAADIALKSEGSLTLLYADRFQPPRDATAPQLPRLSRVIDASRRHAKDELDRCIAECVPPGIEHQVVLIDGLPIPSIADYAETHNIDLIALGTHGRGAIPRILLGSVAEGVMKRTTKPMLTIHDPSRVRPIERIVCSPRARDYGVAIARQFGAGLRVVGPDDILETTDCDLLVVDPWIRGGHNIVRHAHPPVITLPRNTQPVTGEHVAAAEADVALWNREL